MYVTAAQLATRYGYAELAQLAQPDDAVTVAPEMLRLTVEGGDRSAYSADETDAADHAVAAIDTAIADAGAEIDGYLAGRYTLPLAEVPEVLALRAAQVARYHLSNDQLIDKVEAAYKAAVRWLEWVSSGRIQLTTATGEAEATGGAGSAEFVEGEGQFAGRPARGY